MKCDKLEARTIYVDCLGRTIVYYDPHEVDGIIAKLNAENKRLENLCQSYRIDCDNIAIREANLMKELCRSNNKLRTTRRALYKSISNWFKCEVRARAGNVTNKRLHQKSLFEHHEQLCRRKAEEYK